MYSYKRLLTFFFVAALLQFAIPQNSESDSLFILLQTPSHDTTRINNLQELSISFEASNIDTSILILENTARFCNRISNKYNNGILYHIQQQKSNCYYNLSGLFVLKGDSANQLFYLRKCLDLRTTLHDTIGLCDVYISKGLFCSEHGQSEKGVRYFNKSLKLSEKCHLEKKTAEAYNNIGYVEYNNGQIDRALKTYFKGLLIQEDIEDLSGAASSLNNIAFIYYQQDNIEKAFEYWQKSLLYRIQTKDKRLISHSLVNLGSVYYNKGNTEKAFEYFQKSYEIQKELGDKKAEAYSLNNIGFLYNQQKDYKNAQKYWEQCISIRREINDKKGQVYSLQNLSTLYLSVNDNKKALSTAKEAVNLSKEIKIISLEKTSYHRLYKVYYKLKQYKAALLYFTKYIAIKDSLLNSNNTKAIAERDAKYKYDLKQIADSITYSDKLNLHEIKLEKQKALVQKHELEEDALQIGIILILLILILVYRVMRVKHKANDLLRKQKIEIQNQASKLYTQNEEIQAQRDEVEYQKIRIEDIHANVKGSITYAKTIQNAILPQTNSLKSIFSDSFVLFKPKDIVSGDFYWWTNVRNHTIITAADSTGHGVPGAFMSMLGISFLREIVNKEFIFNTGLILTNLRDEVIKSLNQKIHTESLTLRDGMDMAIISINHVTNTLQYSGANNPIYIVTNRIIEELATNIVLPGLYEIKPDKMPVAMYDRMDSFTVHEIQLEPGDQLYLFSDGYSDQFGGPKGKKFKSKPFKKLILENSKKSMPEQKMILNNVFANWQGLEDQVDDVVVIGIKI